MLPALLAAVAASTAAPSSVSLRLSLEPTVIDYELPGHANTRGRGNVGAVARASLIWAANAHVEVELGVLARLPFALDLEDQAGALPIVAITGRPFGDDLLLRFGSLDTRHGYHPAIVDEARYRYGRPVQETYNRSIVPEAHRDLGGDPFVPAEHGAQLIATTELARIEVFLDWQLLETDTHREKFNFGVLGELRSRWADVQMQFRLTHYGGELFTQGDPVRVAQLDPVRQPETLAITVVGRPLGGETVAIDVPATFVSGNMRQIPGGPEAWHYGFEVGADARFFEAARLGYRLWLPRAGGPGFVSEDGDPIYSGVRAHRAIIGLVQRFGGMEIDGRLDLVFPKESNKVQYLAVTRVTFEWEALLYPLDGP